MKLSTCSIDNAIKRIGKPTENSHYGLEKIDHNPFGHFGLELTNLFHRRSVILPEIIKNKQTNPHILHKQNNYLYRIKLELRICLITN